MRKSLEPFWWLLFAAGGTVAAFLIPATIVLTVAAPGRGGGGVLPYARVAALVAHPVVRIYLGGLVALPLFHAAHRIRYGLVEGLHLRRAERLLAVICYGAAIVATALTILTLARL
jgi:fumarate reductase subunit D